MSKIISNLKTCIEAVELFDFKDKANESIAVLREYFTAFGSEKFEELQKGIKELKNIDFSLKDIALIEKSVELEFNEGLVLEKDISLDDIKEEIEKLIKDNNLSPLEELIKTLDNFIESPKKAVLEKSNLDVLKA